MMMMMIRLHGVVLN